MGYFSNGTEGEMYFEEYCSNCIHDKGQRCAVWNAHLLRNYDECNNSESILHMLIPRNKDGFNDECTMFVRKAAVADLFEVSSPVVSLSETGELHSNEGTR